MGIFYIVIRGYRFNLQASESLRAARDRKAGTELAFFCAKI
jgi:hypothetical protein